MKNLYYYLGKLQTYWIEKLNINFKLNDEIIPIYFVGFGNGEKFNLSLSIYLEADEDVIIWKKFRDPSFCRYTTAKFFKYIITEDDIYNAVNNRIKWGITKGRTSVIIIDYKLKIIYIPSKYEYLELFLQKVVKSILLVNFEKKRVKIL